MLCIATVLAVTTISGFMTPWLLLGLTFALSAGDAVESPTWRAVLPELVPKADLPAASALNGIEFNIARAVGPGLAGALIAAAGVGAAFLVNVVSFFGVIVVVARWKRPRRVRSAPSETLRGATVAAIRYVRNVAVMRGLMLRSGVVMFFASAPFALLPAIAHRVSGSAIGYGVLLGCFGVGRCRRCAHHAVGPVASLDRGRRVDGDRHPGVHDRGARERAHPAGSDGRDARQRRRVDRVHLARQCPRPDDGARLGPRAGVGDLHAHHAGRIGGGQRVVGHAGDARDHRYRARLGRRRHDRHDGVGAVDAVPRQCCRCQSMEPLAYAGDRPGGRSGTRTGAGARDGRNTASRPSTPTHSCTRCRNTSTSGAATVRHGGACTAISNRPTFISRHSS